MFPGRAKQLVMDFTKKQYNSALTEMADLGK